MMKKSPDPTLPPAPFLYATAALCGAAIMMVEILGAKLLAPYVGTSHFVWMAQFTVTLLALAFGYFWGGRVADRRAKAAPAFLYIALAGIYLGASVPFVRDAAYACLPLSLPLGSLLASAFLFFVPLSLLAATAPFYVRLLTREVGQVGKQSGRLSAAGTLGSVAGTVLIGYFVIPSLPNSTTMYAIAGLLVLWSGLYFVCFFRKGRGVSLVLLLAGLVGIIWGGYRQVLDNPFGYFSRLYRAQSHFGELQVIESPDGYTRILMDDLLFQNVYDPIRKQSLAEFTFMLQGLSEAYTEKIERVLCLGMGMGIVPMAFSKKGAMVDVVEINETMVEPARRFFDCDTDAFSLTIGDARTFLNETAPQTYDTIILDVFAGDSSPSHLFSAEALTLMRRALKPGGTLVMNTFGSLRAGKNFFLSSLARTLREGAGFESVRIHTEGDEGNIYVLASEKPLPLQRYPDFSQADSELRGRLNTTFNRTVAPPRGGIVLTDDFNPVDFFDAVNREAVRRNYALAVQAY